MIRSTHSVSHAAMGAQLALARPTQTAASALAALEGPLHVCYQHARVLLATGIIVQIRYNIIAKSFCKMLILSCNFSLIYNKIIFMQKYYIVIKKFIFKKFFLYNGASIEF
jgi:hypothetical protein